MDIGIWCCSGHRSSRSITLGSSIHHHDHQSSSSSSTVTSPCKRRYWKLLWMRFKKKGLLCEPPVSRSRCYDPCSYTHNFDDGFAWDDRGDDNDNISRSFSFRFSDPSTIINQEKTKGNCRISDLGVVRKELCV